MKKRHVLNLSSHSHLSPVAQRQANRRLRRGLRAALHAVVNGQASTDSMLVERRLVISARP